MCWPFSSPKITMSLFKKLKCEIIFFSICYLLGNVFIQKDETWYIYIYIYIYIYFIYYLLLIGILYLGFTYRSWLLEYKILNSCLNFNHSFISLYIYDPSKSFTKLRKPLLIGVNMVLICFLLTILPILSSVSYIYK